MRKQAQGYKLGNSAANIRPQARLAPNPVLLTVSDICNGKDNVFCPRGELLQTMRQHVVTA